MLFNNSYITSQWASNIVATSFFLLDFCRDVDRLRIEMEVTSLYDIFSQHHNNVVAVTQRNVKLHAIVTPIFNVVLISDKNENAINNGKHVILFYLSNYSDKIYRNIVYKMQIEMSNFIQVPASPVFSAISEV